MDRLFEETQTIDFLGSRDGYMWKVMLIFIATDNIEFKLVYIPPIDTQCNVDIQYEDGLRKSSIIYFVFGTNPLL